MPGLFWLGVIIAMTGCTTEPPAKRGKISYATHGNDVQPSPLTIPAEIDPPPTVQPGQEGPGVKPNRPPAKSNPAKAAPHP